MSEPPARVQLEVGSLFSGIGGLDLGLERAGMHVRWQSEIDKFCCEVLTRHWPDVPNFGDVTELSDGEIGELPSVDVVCGGFPCQPVSSAGKQEGRADKRWLWPEFARVVRNLRDRPRYVLVENVPGLLTANEGRAFGEILADLAELGFDAEWASVPAAAFGAPHLRYRVCLVAWLHTDADSGRLEERAELDGEAEQASTDRDSRGQHADRLRDDVADTQRARSQGQRRQRELGGGREEVEAERRGADGRENVADPDEERRRRWTRHLRTPRRRQPPHQGWWTVEPGMGRVAHGVPRRVDRLRALGNAVVPQWGQWAGRQIVRMEQERRADRTD